MKPSKDDDMVHPVNAGKPLRPLVEFPVLFELTSEIRMNILAVLPNVCFFNTFKWDVSKNKKKQADS